MKRMVIVLALLAIAACTGESNLPNPTGKGTVRMINAMPGSPVVAFRIEERLIGQGNYKEASTATRWDDFDYIFNFESQFLGELMARTIASQAQKIETGMDYSFVLTGDVTAPVVSIWEGSEREWEDNETVFELRVANVAEANSIPGPIDVYIAPDGTAPAVGEEIATLDFGDIMAPIDMEALEYVVTVTRAGDPLDILYQSLPATFVAQAAVTMPIFDGDENDTASISVLAINALGPTADLIDATALPTIRFIQASLDLADADVYDDDLLTGLILSDHRFGDVTDDLQTTVGQTSYYYTPTGQVNTVLFESGILTVLNTRWNWIAIGDAGARFSVTYVPNRQSISIYSTVTPRHVALQHNLVDFYVVDADVPIDDENPTLSGVLYSLPSPTLIYAAGSYDMYLTLPDEKTIIAGPVRMDLVDGDVLEVMFFDNVNPAIADIVILPTQ